MNALGRTLLVLVPLSWGGATLAAFHGCTLLLWFGVGLGILAQVAKGFVDHTLARRKTAEADKRWEDSQAESRDYVDTAILTIAESVFGLDPDYRFTVFRPDQNGTKVTFYRRFRVGDAFTRDNPHLEFSRGEGLAGQALDVPQTVWPSNKMPEFRTKGEMMQYHIDDHSVSPQRAAELSDFMMRVRFMYSFGVVGRRSQRCVAVICVDSCKQEIEEQDTLGALATVATATLGIQLDDRF